jgi:hypothetical protein
MDYSLVDLACKWTTLGFFCVSFENVLRAVVHWRGPVGGFGVILTVQFVLTGKYQVRDSRRLVCEGKETIYT